MQGHSKYYELGSSLLDNPTRSDIVSPLRLQVSRGHEEGIKRDLCCLGVQGKRTKTNSSPKLSHNTNDSFPSSISPCHHHDWTPEFITWKMGGWCSVRGGLLRLFVGTFLIEVIRSSAADQGVSPRRRGKSYTSFIARGICAQPWD